MTETTQIHQQPQPSGATRPAPGVRTALSGVLGQDYGNGPSILNDSIAAARRKAAQTSPAKQVLEPVTHRGRLVLATTGVDLELETEDGRFELLGMYETEACEGDEVEVTGLPDPTLRHPQTLPAILIRQLRRI